MSVVSQTAHVPAAETLSDAGILDAFRSRRADYAALCRPKIAVMTVVAVAVGFTVASPITFNVPKLIIAAAGIVQLVAASSILNQFLERRTDAMMTRTATRPIADGRIGTTEALFAAMTLATLGTLALWTFVNPATALATLLTLCLYSFVYTVLKSRTSLCTTIGAIPGAMPPVLGWLAAGREFGVETLALFSVFFIWQFPHFLAIGWIHRADYQRAGLRMLPSFSDGGRLTASFAVVYAAAFVPVSLLPAYVGLTGGVYLVVAVVFSVAYLLRSIAFLLDRSEASARKLLYNSLVCLPALLFSLVVDFLRLTAFG